MIIKRNCWRNKEEVIALLPPCQYDNPTLSKVSRSDWEVLQSGLETLTCKYLSIFYTFWFSTVSDTADHVKLAATPQRLLSSDLRILKTEICYFPLNDFQETEISFINRSKLVTLGTQDQRRPFAKHPAQKLGLHPHTAVRPQNTPSDTLNFILGREASAGIRPSSSPKVSSENKSHIDRILYNHFQVIWNLEHGVTVFFFFFPFTIMDIKGQILYYWMKEEAATKK